MNFLKFGQLLLVLLELFSVLTRLLHEGLVFFLKLLISALKLPES